MSDAPVEGQLFRLNYLRSSTKHADSTRARRRVAYLVASTINDTSRERSFMRLVRGELGLVFPGSGGRQTRFFEQAELGDFLSLITLFQRVSPRSDHTLAEMRRILEEEDLHYRIDDQGGVHYLVDEQFAASAEAILRGLSNKKFAASKEALEAALSALTPTHQSGKALIRGIFEAVESAFLVVISQNDVNRINAQSIGTHFRPMMLNHYADVPDGEDKVSRTLDTLESWVRSAHPYRHGVPFDDIHEAPIEEAILSATIGMGFLRFMIQMDGQMIPVLRNVI